MAVRAVGGYYVYSRFLQREYGRAKHFRRRIRALVSVSRGCRKHDDDFFFFTANGESEYRMVLRGLGLLPITGGGGLLLHP